MHSDGKKRRSFVALLFAAGDLRRYVHESLRICANLIRSYLRIAL